ncbi:serine/threonine-protein kinase MARK2-like [Talpa occidentalis]|uniref:serine/threonine-protein kinase MARK2-like n=1 Tax=Talpa occidentalis TaxID=50954 RepID=UPI001890A7B9|nr:serine/threonine-protein kinase MARK2-like [Talpa occidentalis]XP_054552075.1 serine/threonine-protein kinase MARK2-like [Talpa occidentalis]
MLRRRPPKDVKIKNYAVLGALGEGFHAKVKLALHTPTGTEVAIKIIRKDKVAHRKWLASEVGCMKALCHPNIIQLFQVVDTRDELLLVMEYAEGGNLEDYLHQHGRLKESEARQIFWQLLSALSYCHAKGIAHRDLKPENLLLDQHKNIKVADFGLGVQCANQALSTYCGSPEFTAPEIYLHQMYKGPTADVWSLGVILYNMVTGEMPFVGTNARELRDSVLSGHYYEPDYLSEQCRDLLRELMVRDPQSRSALESIIQHPWVRMKNGLLPWREPAHGHHDNAIIEAMVSMGYERHEIVRALEEGKYNDVMGTYLILHYRKREEEGWGHAFFREPSPPPVAPWDLASEACPPQPEVSGEDKLRIVSCYLQTQEFTPGSKHISESSFQLEDATTMPGLQLEDAWGPSTTYVPTALLMDAWEPSTATLPGPPLETVREQSSTSLPTPQLEGPGEHRTTSVPGPPLEGDQVRRSKTSSPAPQPSITTQRPPPRSRWSFLFHSNAVAPAEGVGHENDGYKSKSTVNSNQGRRAKARRIINTLLKCCCFCAPCH